MLTPFSYFDLIETFPKQGCAVCNLLLQDVDRFLEAVLYEHVTNLNVHDSFRASRGLCNEHGWRLMKPGNVLDIAMLYESALDEVLKVLSQTSPMRDLKQGLARLLFPQNPNATLVAALEPTQPCMACKMESETEIQYISILIEKMTDEKMQSAYRASVGLCLEHFKQALNHTHDIERSQLLVDIQSDIWKRLREELAEFTRKYDFHHNDEKMGAEEDSWKRAIARLGGERGVFGVRRPTP
jgi:hypothetical protein